VLTGTPSAPVTVTITEPADPNRVVINPQQLTFIPANAATPQFVTVTAIDDQVLRGTTYSTSLAHRVTSADSNFAILPITTIEVVIQDNECGAWGFMAADLNRDCRVDLNDFAIMAGTWLRCTQPFDTGCKVASAE
jgi:phenylpyruvate tautomerase PptA (4-oxalocrotonate tautomerase family)